MSRLLSPAAVRLLLVTAASMLFTAGCGKVEEKAADAAAAAAIQAATGAQAVEVQDGGLRISGVGEDGRRFSMVQGEKAVLPADFPADIALPEGLALEMVLAVDAHTTLSGHVPASRAAELIARIEAKMGAEGWTRGMDVRQDATVMQIWNKEGRGVNYLLEDHPDGQVLLNLSLSSNP
jgi:hypothetical protein